MNISKKANKQTLTGVIAGIVLVIILGSIYFAIQAYKEKISWLPVENIEEKSTSFVNSELLQGKGSATVKVTGKEGNLYKLEVVYNGQTINSFVSKDGSKFFPQSLEMIKSAQAGSQENTNKTNSETVADNIDKKTDKPVVELFVMSHCPYGLQMEKGIVPVVKALGDKIDFKLKFTDYAMHGEKELKEELNQYCIQKEQPKKLLAYLDAFLKSGDSETSITESGVDKNKMLSCVTQTDKEFKVLENFSNNSGFKGSYPGFEVFKADNAKYNVGGSPTLIINGSQSESARDSKSLLKSICSAFNNQPKECSTQLSGDAPAPGFGIGTAPSGGSGSGCGQ